MGLYPLDPLGLAQQPRHVDRGWARSLYRGPRTVAQVLAEASRAMDEQDERARQAASPVVWLRAATAPRRRLIDRLLRRQA